LISLGIDVVYPTTDFHSLFLGFFPVVIFFFFFFLFSVFSLEGFGLVPLLCNYFSPFLIISLEFGGIG